MTKAKLSLVIVIICLVAFVNRLNADDSINGFTQQTLDGKIINSEALKGVPMVINIGSHW